MNLKLNHIAIFIAKAEPQNLMLNQLTNYTENIILIILSPPMRVVEPLDLHTEGNTVDCTAAL